MKPLLFLGAALSSAALQLVPMAGGLLFEADGGEPNRTIKSAGDGEPDQPANAPFANYDAAMVAFVNRHKIPGASVAVTDHGRLVLARGYGFADLETCRPVTPQSLFRIASLSKPITAVAILQLTERTDLRLDQRVLDVLDQEKAIADAGEPFDPRWRDVTVEHLLLHRGGWDRDRSFDPMFQSVRFAEAAGRPAPADADAVIAAMLCEPLDFDPGTQYAYSNFGYCLLGRIVEHVSGQDYEAYVRQHVLEPLGITSMRIGRTHRDRRAAGEVCYYHSKPGNSEFEADLGESVPSPYGAWYLEAMDSHGGWIASAIDLARFAAAFDDPDHCPILSPKSVRLMNARPNPLPEDGDPNSAGDRYYSFGWNNRIVGDDSVNHWHTGSLPGTAAIMIRRHDGKNFIGLLNTRESAAGDNLFQTLDRLLHRMADEVPQWPSE